MTDDEPPEVPHAPAPAQTLIMDAGSQRQLLWIDGLVPLPVGARVELNRPHRAVAVDGVVTSVRLWGAEGGSSTLVLDVMLIEPDSATDLP
jgi:hypothetical protein